MVTWAGKDCTAEDGWPLGTWARPSSQALLHGRTGEAAVSEKQHYGKTPNQQGRNSAQCSSF